MFTFRGLAAFFRKPPPDELTLALREIARGEYAQALRRLDQLRAGGGGAKERAVIANKRGVALVKLGRREEAREAFGEAIEILPGHAPALVNCGNLHLEEDQITEAVGWYERAILADPGYAPARHHLGLAYKRLGRTSDAMRQLKRGVFTSRGRYW